MPAEARTTTDAGWKPAPQGSRRKNGHTRSTGADRFTERPPVRTPIPRLLAAILLARVSATTFAQPMADRLPATTLVYSGWSPGASLQNTKAARMLADERLIHPWRGLLDTLLSSLADDAAGAANGQANAAGPRL